MDQIGIRTERPAEKDLIGLLNWLVDDALTRSAETLRMSRMVGEQMLTADDICERLQVAKATFYKWKSRYPWKLPNWGISSTGPECDYRCTLSAFYDWYSHTDSERQQQWDDMAPEERRKVLGLSA